MTKTCLIRRTAMQRGRCWAALLVVFLVLVSNEAWSTEYLVSSASEIQTALQTAGPGDILTMTNGTWTNQQIEFNGFGNSSNPITLRAQTPGQVVINGNSTLDISGDWLVVDGLKFEGGALPNGSRAIVEFRGDYGEATNSRFTNSAIVSYNPVDINDRYHWVEIFGQDNRVDHNYFKDQNHSGVTVVVRRDNASANYHQIDFNYFADRPEGNGNGWETIRVGTSDQSLSDSFTVVENNLFERVDGEIEMISNKSGNNTYRYNTFRESAATLTLRHGNDNLVEGNFFLGMGVNQTGAIRVIGERQTIVNNYIANVDDRAGAAISISAGVPNSALNQYYQVKDAVIAHNTVVDTLGAMVTFDDGLGSSGRTLLAENVTMANNLFRSSGPTIFEGNEGSNWTWQGNIAYGGGLGPTAGNPGVTVVNPQLTFGSDGLWRPAAGSPAINGAVGDFSGTISDDMDGQPRIGLFDVGADEFSVATIVRKPLTGNDVGPDWLDNGPPDGGPSGGGCGPSGCAIQAENFTSILDPDSNGAIFTVVNEATALGGQVIKAPSGSIVSPPNHNTIATFDLMFETAGTYTAYYRARGFSGSTDSIYTPDNFGVDPDNADTLSSNGVFRWEKDPLTFTISQPNVGIPLEFRLGMREQLAEIDAFVLHLNSSLTDQELDDLFAFLPGDYNGNGVVDAADYTVWRDMSGQTGTGLAADGTGDDLLGTPDGDVDEFDFLFWRANFGNTLVGGSGSAEAVAIPEPPSLKLVCLSGMILLGQHFRQSTSKRHDS